MIIGLPLDVWEHILGFGPIKSFCRLLQVSKDLHRLGMCEQRKQRLFEKIAMREMQEQALSGTFYPSSFKRHCTPDLMLKFAATDAAKRIVSISFSGCSDIQREFSGALEAIMRLPLIECVSCFRKHPNVMEVAERVNLQRHNQNCGFMYFFHPDIESRRWKRQREGDFDDDLY